MALYELPPLELAIANSLDTGQFSDLTINCSGRKYSVEGKEGEYRSYKVHKLVVCTQSGFFAKLCEGPWKESQEHIVNLGSDDSIDCSVVEAILAFLYTGDYSHYAETNDKDRKRATLSFNVEVYAGAEKYMIPGLKARALANFQFWAAEMRIDPPYGIEDTWDMFRALTLSQNLLPPTENKLRPVIKKTFNRLPENFMKDEVFETLLERIDNLAIGLGKTAGKEKLQKANAAKSDDNAAWQGLANPI